MQDNRNSLLGGCSQDGRGTVCIDTFRVLDSCRDRDCFEDTRVYLTPAGESAIACATGVRTKSAKLLWAFVGVDEVPFNCGFFQVTVRYYILVEIEVCLGIGRSQTFCGVAIAEKDVILFGGEGDTLTFRSHRCNDFCGIGNIDTAHTNDPVAYVEVVEPVVLGTKIVERGCGCPACEQTEIPECVCEKLEGEPVIMTDGPRLYVSLGIFSVVKIERPAQLLVQATDYSVPEKECVAATNDENPCALFRNMAFPVHRFRTDTGRPGDNGQKPTGGCACGNR